MNTHLDNKNESLVGVLPKLFDKAEVIQNWSAPMKTLEIMDNTENLNPLPDWLAVEMIWMMVQFEQIQRFSGDQEQKNNHKKLLTKLKSFSCWQQVVEFDGAFPLLDNEYMRHQGVKVTINCLSEFLAYTKSKDISPHILFKVIGYKDNEKLNKTEHHPLVHFFRHSSGYRDKSPAPNKYFDCDWYRGKYLQNHIGKNPLLHYLECFQHANIQPSQHFHNDYVRDIQGLSSHIDPLAYYLEQLQNQENEFCRDGFSPCPYFDRTFYLSSYEDIKIAAAKNDKFDPFWHFSTWGFKEGRKGHFLLRHNMATESMIRDFPTKKRLAILVLGMHRSGTSAITRTFNLLGFDLSDQLMEANFANETGYWESLELARIHDDILASLDSSWDDIFPIESNRLQSVALKDYKALLTDYIVREFNHSDNFVLKDPRMCKLLPLWLDVLDNLNIQVKVVVPFRNPLEVAESLKKRDGFLLEKSFLLWLRHILDVEQHTRKLSRCFVSYTSLLEDYRKVLDQVASQCELNWPEYSDDSLANIAHFIDGNYYHQRASEDGLLAAQVPGWISQAYIALNDLSQDGNEARSIEKLVAIAESINQADRLYGSLITDKEQTFRRVIDAYRHKQTEIQQYVLHIQQLCENEPIILDLSQPEVSNMSSG